MSFTMPCPECGRYGSVDCMSFKDEIHEVKENGRVLDCWRARGSVFIWDEKVEE